MLFTPEINLIRKPRKGHTLITPWYDSCSIIGAGNEKGA